MAVFINFTSHFFFCETRRCHVFYKDEGGKKNTITVKVVSADPIRSILLKNTNNDNDFDKYLETVKKEVNGKIFIWSGKIEMVSQRNNNKPFKIVFLTKTKQIYTPSLYVMSKRRPKLKEAKLSIKRSINVKEEHNLGLKKRKKDENDRLNGINKKLKKVLQNQMQILKTLDILVGKRKEEDDVREKENIIQKSFDNIQEEYFDFAEVFNEDMTTKNALGY